LILKRAFAGLFHKEDENMEAKQPQRRYDLDWLRVLAFSGVFFYHCSRFFNTAGWHIKNAETSSLVDIFTGIFDLFGMPMIFAISGASIFFALRPAGVTRFLRERALRLLLPLVVGILVLAPPQVYLDRFTHGVYRGTFLEFLPYYFTPANFAWNGVHLWYLVYLFIFTLFLLPLFIWLKRPSGQRALRYLSKFTERPGAIFLWAVPVALVSIVVDPFSLIKQGLSESLLRLVMFPLPLIYGYLIYADHAIQQAIIRQRRTFLFLSVGFTLFPPLVSMAISQWGWKINLLSYTVLMALCSLLIWCYLLTAFGYGMRYLTSNKRSLAYANEAVLPFYILHQPVILLLGYFIIQLRLPILAKYLIITPLALSVTLMLYEYGVRRVNTMRRAFGLKPRKQDPASVKVAAQWS
jgi:glucan biosynthesis protein C